MLMLHVFGREARAFSDEPITSGSVGLPVCFRFDSAWEDLTRTAVFRISSGESLDVLLDQDRCTVPPELLSQPGESLYLGVYGTDRQGRTVIPTLWATVGLIEEGAAPSGESEEAFTPALVDQILGAVGQAVRVAESVRADADSGAFDGPQGPKGDQGPAGEAPFGTQTPLMDGTAAPGSSANAAREDHVHPTDTSRADRSIYTDSGVDLGKEDYPGTNTATNSIILRSPFFESAAGDSNLGVGAVKMGNKNGQLQVGAVKGVTAANKTQFPWLTDYIEVIDGSEYYTGEVDGLSAVGIGSSKALAGASFAAGTGCLANKSFAMAFGQFCRAAGLGAFALGNGVDAIYNLLFAIGARNDPKQGDVFEVGNGKTVSGAVVRSNAFRVTDGGKAIAQTALGIEDGNGGTVEITAAQLAAAANPDAAPASGSTNLITSGAVYAAIQSAIGAAIGGGY